MWNRSRFARKVQPCKFGLVSLQKWDPRFEYVNARVQAFTSCLRRTRYLCLASPSPQPSTIRPFHHASRAPQAASCPSVASFEDGDGSIPSTDVASVGDDLGDHDTGQGKSSQKTDSRDTFRLDIPKVNIHSALETMKLARTHGLPTEEVVLESSPQPATSRWVPTLEGKNERLAAHMKAALERDRQGVEWKALLGRRQLLPLMAEDTQQAILKIIDENDVTIILAKTGSGKTTQVPQILLDDMIMSGRGPNANIVCTQPRRIAATSIAQRVAQERHDTTGNTVGYHIRNEYLVPKARRGSITYCTTGILLNRLIADADRTLSTHSHIIVDEVHERDIQIDLVLSLLRNAVRARKAAGPPHPKIVLMSATIDPSAFLDYLTRPADDGTALDADCLNVEGSHAHIEDHYLPEILQELTGEKMRQYIQGNHSQSSKHFIEHEMKFAAAQRAKDGSLSSIPDTNDQPSPQESPQPNRVGLAASLIAHIAATKPDGDILAFFPGSSDMEHAEQLLLNGQFSEGDFDIQDASKFRLFKLHSLLKETNYEVFEPVPEGCRRIILATNIAETSITLPEVVYIVDSGMERTSCFDHSTLARSLPYSWISKTSLIQRRGRAGRVRDGHYYALFTKERHDSFRGMNRPELGETDLAEVALQFKTFVQNADVKSLLLDTLDPPSRHAITNAIRQLQSLGALTETGAITSLGRILWRLGVHPALGKAILLGCLFGCLEPMLIIACHDAGAPLVSNLQLSMERVKQVRQQYLPDDETDFAWIIEAFREYHVASVARRQELSLTKNIRRRAYFDMMLVSEEIHGVLARVGFVPPPQPGKTLFEVLPSALNANRDNMALIKGLLVNTVSAELAVWPGTEPIRNYKWTIDSPHLKGLTSKSSVNEANTTKGRKLKKKYRSHGRLMAYTFKKEAPDAVPPIDKVFLEQASMITPLLAILFCRSLTLQPDQTLQLNNWLPLQISTPPGQNLPRAIAEQSATILMELRKTVDRFTSLAWLELERLNRSKGEDETSNSTDPELPKQRLGAQLRKVMVEAVLKMINEDQAYWNKFRTRRRAEIAAEVERLEKAAAKSDSSDKVQTQDPDADGDEDELDFEKNMATALSRHGSGITNAQLPSISALGLSVGS
ncbi:hypothetical protein H2200_008049 [Cladophialophora chaetospira]|uniref:RNA helicase n=1 Tax=Cladophialophora chaetospira TaxID=386627 RepID=A0AA38X6X1_9EURO|nr:hypothetical protein H2200_008049 [Cladophialophora chaetospira]